MNAVKDTSKLTHVIMHGADHSIKTEKFRAVFTKIIIDWFGKRV